MSDFPIFVERILKHEAGYVNHPNDPGGETNLGITWPVLRRGIGAGIIPVGTTIRSLTKPQAIKLYEAYFWKEPKYDQLPPALAFQVFDAGVNHGTDRATKWLQSVLGVAVDGSIGPNTLSAVRAYNQPHMIFKFFEVRVGFYTGLGTWSSFGKGWMNRMVGNFGYAAEDL